MRIGIGASKSISFSQKNNGSKAKTFRNTFVTISYGSELIQKRQSQLRNITFPLLSIGYLFDNNGNYYDKNTFKVGLGRFSLSNGSTKIEPTVYFNNFFKGVTPSLRITQRF